MKMRSQTKQKALSLLITFNLIINSMAPFFAFVRPVVSAEPLKAEISFSTDNNTFDISVNTKEEVTYVLSWLSQDGVQGTTVTKSENNNEDFQQDIYAGVKSGTDARQDKVVRGIYKAEVTSQHWITAIKFALDDGKLIDEGKTVYEPDQLELTDEELKWIEYGDVTPTPTIEATITPAQTEEGDILEEGITTQQFMTADADGTVKTEVVESYQCRADSLNGCLITDKDDYAPTEMAIISGYGFAPFTIYTIRISSSDEPATQYETEITTDSHGAFSVSYQLDGIYRPNYLVQLFDLNGVEVARVTFTDSQVTGCIIDSGGANDVAGQKDLNKMCVDYSGLPYTELITWQWDDIGWTGANTGDACALFDTNNNGKADYAVCVQVSENPATYLNQFIYSCNDSSATNCLGDNLISPTNTTCVASVQDNIDPFSGPVKKDIGEGYPKDTIASCTVSLSDVGGPNANLIDVCSYPSASTPSNASDCIVFRENAGKLTVTKILSPNNDQGLFNLQIDEKTHAPNVGNGGTTLVQSVSVGNHSVGETEGTSTSLGNYSASVSCKNDNGTGSEVITTGSNPWSLNVANGSDILCTITNTRINDATITIIKDAEPNDPQDFTFTTTGTGLSDFSLYDDTDNTLSNTKVFTNLAAGTYSVTETVPDGWIQTSATCTDNSPVSAINLSAGENVTCTFTNTKKPKLTVNKILSPSNDTGLFNLQINGTTYANNIGNGGSTESQYGIIGSNTIGEAAGTGTNLSDYTVTYGGDCTTNSITLAAGDDKTCTITNTRNTGTIELKKVWSGTGGQTTLKIGTTVGNNDVASQLTGVDGGDPLTTGQKTVNTGTYYLSETGGLNNYSTAALSCFNDADNNGTNNGESVVIVGANDSVPVAKSEHVICTYTNTRNTGKIQLDKDFEGTTENVTIKIGTVQNGSQVDSVELSADGTTGENTVDTGTYYVSETLANPSNYSVVLACFNDVNDDDVIDEGDTSHSVNTTTGEVLVGTDEDVICRFTNTRKQGTITVYKNIDNNNDGDLDDQDDVIDASGWTWNITDGDQDIDMGETKTLDTGDYNVTENEQSDYAFVSWNCSDETEGVTNSIDISLNDGDEIVCNFVNTPLSTLHGYKWHDEDLSGGPEAGISENLLSGWTIYLYKAVEEGVYTLIDSKVTDNSVEHFGWYWFENLFPGDYRICEENQTGWNQTYPLNDSDNCHEVTLPLDSSGEMITESVQNAVAGPMYNFGNVSLGKVVVTKYNDLNGNGMRDEGEPTLPDWEILLSENGSQTTDENGIAEFDGVTPGNYVLDEVMQGGWEQTAISCSVPVEPTPTPTVPVDLTGTPTITPTPTPVPFNNICHWNEGADKWNALSIPDSNKGHDDHEEDFPYGGNVDSKGHPVSDPHNKDNPELNGDAWCEANKPAARGFIFGLSQVVAQESQIEGEQVTVEPGKVVNCEIGNQQINPELQISKSNDATGDKSTGDTVIYTINVKALTSKVLGVVLKDLLPNGFTFQNVISIMKNGTEDITALVGNPNYASPGTYNLGDMNVDDEIVIKYAAKVGSVDPGKYKDMAYATGKDVLDNRVIAQAQPVGYVSTNFVGTSVTVNANLTQSGNINMEGEVLGASTFLPATGANAKWIMMGALLTVMGLLFMMLGFLVKRKKLNYRMFGKIVAGLMLMAGVLLLPVKTEAAAGDLIIRLEQPKSPTSVNEFKITYVVMDLTESPSSITVKCFKKGPSDGGYSQFGSTQNVTAGGNSGNCDVTSSVMSSNGTYQFYATASNGTDTATSESEGIISVGYNTVGDPVPPSSYKKEKISSCQYKITFKTADDGKTERVEIYRSESTTFNLDGSTRVADINIGPNQTGEFIESVPDCDKTYYYAMRSFNSAGNPSGPVGDSAATVTTSTSQTSDTGAIAVVNVTLPAGEGGLVLGEEKEATASPSQEPEEVDVKGVSDIAKKAGDFAKSYRNYIIGVLGLIIAVAVYVFIKKRKKDIEF